MGVVFGQDGQHLGVHVGSGPSSKVRCSTDPGCRGRGQVGRGRGAGTANRGAGSGVAESRTPGWWLRGGRRYRCHRSLRGEGRTMGDGSVRDGDADTRVVADGRCDAEPGPAAPTWSSPDGRHETWLPAHCSPGQGTGGCSPPPLRRPRAAHCRRSRPHRSPLSHGHAAGRSRPNTVERRTGVTGGAGGAAACRAAAPVVLPFRSRCPCINSRGVELMSSDRADDDIRSRGVELMSSAAGGQGPAGASVRGPRPLGEVAGGVFVVLGGLAGRVGLDGCRDQAGQRGIRDRLEDRALGSAGSMSS